jgi:hypothetical protein
VAPAVVSLVCLFDQPKTATENKQRTRLELAKTVPKFFNSVKNIFLFVGVAENEVAEDIGLSARIKSLIL